MADLPIGVAKRVAFNTQADFNTLPSASGAQEIRRVESNLKLSTDTFESDEITSTYQVTDVGQGMMKAEGSARGRISPGTWSWLFAAAVRKAFPTAPTTGALTNVTASATGPHFVRAAGSFISDGFRCFQVVRWSGWAAPATGNNARNYLIIALTATQMTVLELGSTTTVVAKAAGDSVTLTLAGKQTWVPQSGHTRPVFAIEEYHSDLGSGESELFHGLALNTMDINWDPKGYAEISNTFVGKGQLNTSGSAYYTSPAAITSAGLITPVDGLMIVGGSVVATITGAQLKIDEGVVLADPTIGNGRAPVGAFPGRVKLSGSFNCYMDSMSIRDKYINATDVSLVLVGRSTAAANADFVGLVAPLVRLTSADKSGEEKGVMRSYNFTGKNNITATGADQTTLAIQDSLAP